MKIDKHAHKPRSTLRVAATRSGEGPTTQKAVTAHQTAGRGTPRESLRLARRPGTTPQVSTSLVGLTPPWASPYPARGLDAPSGESPPRSRAGRPSDESPPRSRNSDPRASLRLARGRPRPATPPRRPSDTAWESYPSAVPPTHAVWPSPALCGSCVGRPVLFHDAVPPTPVPPPSHPIKRRWWNA
jgi:hypothetical protein